jgi:hypothetical protein
MGSVVVLTIISCVFFIRDLQLLTAGHPQAIGRRLATYSATALTYIAVLGYFLPDFESHPLLFFRKAPLWGVAVLVHSVIWITCVRLKRSNRTEWEWLATLFPAPVFLVAIVAFGASLRAVFATLHPLLSIMMVMAGWCLLISCAALFISRSPSRRSDEVFALEFAGFANIIVLILVPLHSMLPGSVFSR